MYYTSKSNVSSLSWTVETCCFICFLLSVWQSGRLPCNYFLPWITLSPSTWWKKIKGIQKMQRFDHSAGTRVLEWWETCSVCVTEVGQKLQVSNYSKAGNETFERLSLKTNGSENHSVWMVCTRALRIEELHQWCVKNDTGSRELI